MTNRSKSSTIRSILTKASVVSQRGGLFVGIDLHRDVMQLEIQTSSGRVLLNEQFSTAPHVVGELLDRLQGRVRKMTCEATGFWYWFADLCQERRIPLILANPRKLRVIADSVKKCDRLDAHWLCEFLRHGYVDEAAVPQQEARDRRELLRARECIKRHVQDLKRRVRSFLMQYGLRVRAKDPFSVKGLRELRELELRPFPRTSLDLLLSALEGLLGELAAVDAMVHEMAKEEGPAYYLQQEVRGIGPILATTILAEAMDVGRFQSPRKFAAHAGVVPKVRESAGKQSAAGITKQGPRYLRWGLVQAARLVVAHDPVVKKWYQRHRRRKGAQRAYVMVAHKLARYIHMFFVDGVCFEPAKLFPPARRRRPKNRPARRPASATAS